LRSQRPGNTPGSYLLAQNDQADSKEQINAASVQSSYQQGCAIMVREGPAEPPPANVTERAEAERARPSGMLLTTLVVAAVIVVVIYLLAR